MARIVTKRHLNPTVTLLELESAPIARKAKPGQFVILRVDELGERIPLTIADYDSIRGTVTVMYQSVGLTTKKLDLLESGDEILDLVGPLGNPTEVDHVKRVVVIGGGVGCAIAFPQAKFLYRSGVHVDVIVGFRNKDLMFLEGSFRKNCTNLYITTDDGSYGEKGFVTTKLKELLDGGAQYDLAIAIGPVPMMRMVSETTKPYGLHTIVSLNPVMVDGTGMCGGCRVKVGGEVKFACVDGPDFDGHQVDYDELMTRNSVYKDQETSAAEVHRCRMQALSDAAIMGGKRNG
jgi:ferredoxin--NADP+ reductase